MISFLIIILFPLFETYSSDISISEKQNKKIVFFLLLALIIDTFTLACNFSDRELKKK